MGKIQILTNEQRIILDEVKQDSFFRDFYLTGGTALSAFYLYHRYSEDLDFFTEKPFNIQEVDTILQKWADKYHFTFTSEFRQVVYVSYLTFQNKEVLKVDFAHYAHKRLQPGEKREDITIDSITDIATNKLLTITQRRAVKDFVDLYFLLESYTIWDLLQGVRIKFRRELEPFMIAADFLWVEKFDFLPRMIKQLTLEELKAFFRQKAKEVGGKAVE